MKWPKRKYLLLIVGILLLPLLGYLAYILFVQEQYVLTTLDAGANREIRIWADTYFENCQRFYYEIRVNGQVTSPISFIDCRNEEPKFRLLYSKDRHLVGVVEVARPEILVVINDFASGETWPRGNDKDSWEEKLSRGRHLKDRLNADNPQMNLALSDEVP
jgi:hypothetical protein